MQTLENIVGQVSNFMWGPAMLILLFGTHIYLTIRLKFPQRYIGKMIKMGFGGKKEGEGDISQFGALTTALAATIGTGNIVGVSTAIAAGGPGAVLWMWLTGVFGISTKYAEALLAIKYRVKTANGTMAGGPMYALERGLKQKWLAVFFAAMTAITAFFIGNAVQANSITSMVNETFQIPSYIIGIILAVITAIVIIGGVKRIASVCEKLVPFMAVFYVIGCMFLLAKGYKTLPNTLQLIVSSAFTGQAAAGGFLGATVVQAMRFGVARGLFSNESGLGSAPIVAAAAQTKNPVRQALVSASGTFWDTVVVCAITGLVIVNSGEWMNGYNGAKLTKEAYCHMYGVGKVILSVGLLTFVFSTILGWCYYGEKCVEYLFGTKSIKYYRWLWVMMVFVGSVASLGIVWGIADITNALMAIPNLISLLFLSGVTVAATRKYLWENRLDEAGD